MNDDGMIWAIDFDGTIVDHAFPLIGREVPDACMWLRRFQKAGARLILWTMRSSQPIEETDNPLMDAVKFCAKRGVRFWNVNHNPEQDDWTDSPKCYAHGYIDDAAIGTPLHTLEGSLRPCVNWGIVGPMAMERIEAFQGPKPRRNHK